MEMTRFIVGLFMVLAAAVAIAYIVVNGPRPVDGGTVQPVVVTQLVPVNVYPVPTMPASVPVNVMETPFYVAPTAAPAEFDRNGIQAPTASGQVGTHDPGTNHKRTP
jgi:hypothetical protein